MKSIREVVYYNGLLYYRIENSFDEIYNRNYSDFHTDMILEDSNGKVIRFRDFLFSNEYKDIRDSIDIDIDHYTRYNNELIDKIVDYLEKNRYKCYREVKISIF